MSDAVKTGDKVSISYEGKLSNGDVFDSNQGSTPFSFTVGSGEVIAGMGRDVIGMKVGDKKVMKIEAEDEGVEMDNEGWERMGMGWRMEDEDESDEIFASFSRAASSYQKNCSF